MKVRKEKLVLFLFILILILLQYPLWFSQGSLFNVWWLKREISEQKAENARLVERNRVLEAEVIDLKHGLEAIEERGRSELGMIKKGETFFHVVEKQEKDQTNGNSAVDRKR